MGRFTNSEMTLLAAPGRLAIGLNLESLRNPVEKHWRDAIMSESRNCAGVVRDCGTGDSCGGKEPQEMRHSTVETSI